MKSFFYAFFEIVIFFAIAFGTVLGIRYFLVQPYLVNGMSMEPNFKNGDYILVNEISYRFRQPERGEVIVFHYPGDEKIYYIKRIIGLPKEEVAIKDGRIYVSNREHPKGFVLDETYLPQGLSVGSDKKIVLGPSEYFVMGDNRNFSYDSRAWGPVKSSEIVGVAWLRLWPFNRVMAFEKPAY